jgi:hypothetical protein
MSLPACGVVILIPCYAPSCLQLLSLIEPLDRGIAAGPEDLQAVEKVVQALERTNPTSRPIKSDLVNGKWEVSVLGCVV